MMRPDAGTQHDAVSSLRRRLEEAAANRMVPLNRLLTWCGGEELLRGLVGLKGAEDLFLRGERLLAVWGIPLPHIPALGGLQLGTRSSPHSKDLLRLLGHACQALSTGDGPVHFDPSAWRPIEPDGSGPGGHRFSGRFVFLDRTVGLDVEIKTGCRSGSLADRQLPSLLDLPELQLATATAEMTAADQLMTLIRDGTSSERQSWAVDLLSTLIRHVRMDGATLGQALECALLEASMTPRSGAHDAMRRLQDRQGDLTKILQFCRPPLEAMGLGLPPAMTWPPAGPWQQTGHWRYG